MFYLLIAPFGVKCPPLTYSSSTPCQRHDICAISVRGRQCLGVVLCEVEKPSFACKEAVKKEGFFLPAQELLAQFIARYYCVGLGEAYSLLVPLLDSEERELIAQKTAQKTAQKSAKKPTQKSSKTPSQISESSSNPPSESRLDSQIHTIDSDLTLPITLKTLNPAQQNALEAIGAILASPSPQSDTPSTPPLSSVLLFGDTGSGKSEIYFHLIAQALRRGQNALFLMPEISLTPQMESRLKAVFGECIAIWHSKITKPQKRQILYRLQKGEVRLIAGARSALFLPIAKLGLIVVDEEHDEAYKSQASPRYNAKDLALYLGAKLCEAQNLRVILGSATPSLSSYFRAKNEKSLVRLQGRHFSSQKHIVFEDPSRLIESRAIASSDEQSGEIALIADKIRPVLERGEQAIVFLPTRAHYKMLICRSCAQGVQCEFCSVNMSLHLDKNALVCHYCHFSKPIPSLCPSCGAPNMSAHRMGTALVAQSLQKELPEARIALFDRDHITTHHKLKSILSDFNHGKIDVLVGTQMLSKGHDYHRVNLAVVLGIDYVLQSSDYRAHERAVSLLYQIAGRSGRKDDGCVYIQSHNVALLEPFMGDYEDFLRYELESRPKLYPPFWRLATLTFSHKNETKAYEALCLMREYLYSLRHEPRFAEAMSEVELVGESRALLERIQDKFRFMLLLRARSPQPLLKVLHALQHFEMRHFEQLSGVCEIDVDPLSVI